MNTVIISGKEIQFERHTTQSIRLINLTSEHKIGLIKWARRCVDPCAYASTYKRDYSGILDKEAVFLKGCFPYLNGGQIYLFVDQAVFYNTKCKVSFAKVKFAPYQITLDIQSEEDFELLKKIIIKNPYLVHHAPGVAGV